MHLVDTMKDQLLPLKVMRNWSWSDQQNREAMAVISKRVDNNNRR